MKSLVGIFIILSVTMTGCQGLNKEKSSVKDEHSDPLLTVQKVYCVATTATETVTYRAELSNEWMLTIEGKDLASGNINRYFAGNVSKLDAASIPVADSKFGDDKKSYLLVRNNLTGQAYDFKTNEEIDVICVLDGDN